MQNLKLFSLLFILALLSSCVSKKKFLEMQDGRDAAQKQYETLKMQFDECQSQAVRFQTNVENLRNQLGLKEQELAVSKNETENERNRIRALQEQINYLQQSNSNLLDRLSDLSVVSKTGAENIKKSLETLSKQGDYIKQLNTSMQRKDSVNLILVMNLKRSLEDVNDEDVTVEVKKGVVYISLSDKMLFRSGSSVINTRAEEVLGKIARVLKDHKDLDILVEGHTDTVPIKTACLEDNWDLSVKRATSVVRVLQVKHNVNPARMTAGGRSEYIPKADNSTERGRSINRRTEIIILPKLDQFFQLLEAPTADVSK
jgi:chemotaxis protein MotB